MNNQHLIDGNAITNTVFIIIDDVCTLKSLST